ncbi:hypothetical protein RRG08_066293 [Elysia crispata]|uniref:Uncharacterized protein n=1 Tax=Elysia crispata TaxID=231223 RepID=A0AAE1AML2_9GAST|nr:hypothetical protein RRG08_066293 [Elysia crispata]
MLLIGGRSSWRLRYSLKTYVCGRECVCVWGHQNQTSTIFSYTSTAAWTLGVTSRSRAASQPARAASQLTRAASQPARAASQLTRAASQPARAASQPARAASQLARAASQPARAASQPASSTPVLNNSGTVESLVVV